MKHQHEFSKKGDRVIKGAFIIRSSVHLPMHPPPIHTRPTLPSYLLPIRPSIIPPTIYPPILPFVHSPAPPSFHPTTVYASLRPPTLPTSIHHPPFFPLPILSSIFLTWMELLSCARNILKSPEKNPRNLRGGEETCLETSRTQSRQGQRF